MKNFLSLIFYCFSIAAYSQVNSVLPPEAEIFYNHAMQTIKPEIKSTIQKNANKLKNRIVDADSLSGFLRRDESLRNLTHQGMEAVIILIMVQASKNADAELKNMVLNRQKDLGKNASSDNPHAAVVGILSNKSQIASNVSELMRRLGNSGDLVLADLK